MRWTVRKLRISLVALSTVLTLGIVASLLYARWQVRHVVRDLPAKLGIQIQQSTEGFTYSKTEQGRTVFTLHAAKALQYRTSGRALLHDVRIQVFNQQDGQTDTITSSQFEYDPDRGTVQSQDEAQIDLHTPAPPAAGAQAAQQGAHGAQQERTIHVLTHGLVFNQKTGIATTDGLLEFHMAQGNGQAVGAVYDSKQGLLLLKADVVLHTQTQKGPAVIHAAQAVYEQHAGQIQMEGATYTTATEHASARRATVELRPDNSAKGLEAEQEVQYQESSGDSVSADTMVAALDDNSRPQTAHFHGNVHFQMQQQQDSTQGLAEDGQFYFNPQGRLRQGRLDRNVRVQQRILSSPTPIERNLQAAHLLMEFVAGTGGHAELKQATATGDAVFHQQSSPGQRTKQNTAQKAAQNTAQDTTVSAQQLVAYFAPGQQLLRVDGRNDTRLRSVAANGDIDTSSGDTLQVLFDAVPSATHTPKRAARTTDAIDTSTIRSAVQQGHVLLQQTAAPGPVHGATLHGGKQDTQLEISTVTADKAVYQGATQLLTLTGSPYFKDAEVGMSAKQMQVYRSTGEVTAIGAVQTTVRGGGPVGGLLGGSGREGNGPTHVIADQANLDRNTQHATFTGHARLWQGQNVVEAPVVEVLQAQQELVAHGASQRGAVHCAFVASQTPGAPGGQGPTPVYVVSDRLLYSDAEHKAHFTGHVEVTMQGSQLYSEVADVYLQPAPPAAPEGKNMQTVRNNSTQTPVERIDAKGNVRLVQPGRHGTGAEIVYTASDGRFVLTGSGQAPPVIVDAERGSLTGKTLIYESEQNTVLVQGGNASTTTKTRVQK
jgi:lipopolysaccharide export system protein LptA